MLSFAPISALPISAIYAPIAGSLSPGGMFIALDGGNDFIAVDGGNEFTALDGGNQFVAEIG